VACPCTRGSAARSDASDARLRHRGTCETVGCDVTRFRVGEEVYGDNLGLKGGFAENAVAPESVLAHNPET
jgi:NADPH:quinone reductase-like Zn-dependent oxidoreductase